MNEKTGVDDFRNKKMDLLSFGKVREKIKECKKVACVYQKQNARINKFTTKIH